MEQNVRSLLPSREQVESVLGRRVNELPPFPLVALKLLEITRDDRKSSADIARVVEADPSIAAKTLRIVNSAAYGALRQISSIKHAVVLLGVLEIRAIALAVTLFENIVRPGHGAAFDRVFFWKHSICMAALCRAMAQELRFPDPEEAYVAGLLHDIGKVIIDSYGKVRYGAFIAAAQDHNGALVDQEDRLIGLRHDDAGAYFCDAWQMPERLVRAILLHHRRFGHLKLNQEDATLVSVVALSDFITWNQGVGSVNTPRQPVLSPEVASHVRLDQLDLQSLMARMDREMRSTADYYGFGFPSSENFRESLLRANIDLGQKNARYFQLHGNLKKELETFSRLKESITRPHRSLDPKAILSGTLETIQQSFDFDRVFAMKVDPVHRHLTIVQAMDRTNLDVDLERLRIRLDSSASGFIDCLRSHVPILISGRTPDEVRALESLKVTELGVVPVASNNKIVGIIGVDNAASQDPLQLSDLSAVAIVTNELGIALANAKTVEEIKTRASRDGLTNVYNRASIDTFLKEAFKAAQSGETRLSLAMIDVDHFKRFNDSFGHLAGDSILKLVAGTLTKFSRSTQIVGRYGGEEFLCVLNGTDLEAALNYGERMRRKVEDLGQLLIKRFPGYQLSISVGVAAYEPEVKSPAALIDRADRAMYQAKQSGRNRVMHA